MVAERREKQNAEALGKRTWRVRFGLDSPLAVERCLTYTAKGVGGLSEVKPGPFLDCDVDTYQASVRRPNYLRT